MTIKHAHKIQKDIPQQGCRSKSDNTVPQMGHPARSFSSLSFKEKTEHTVNLQLQPVTLSLIIPSVCSFKMNHKGLEKKIDPYRKLVIMPPTEEHPHLLC